MLQELQKELLVDDLQDPPAKYKVSQQVLSDFAATVTAKPNLNSEELLGKFPEFNNNTSMLQSALDYTATSKSGKYKDVEALNAKFPEFDFASEEKKASASFTPQNGSNAFSNEQFINTPKTKQQVLDNHNGAIPTSNGSFMYKDNAIEKMINGGSSMSKDATSNSSLINPMDVAEVPEKSKQKLIKTQKDTETAINLTTANVLKQQGVNQPQGSVWFNAEKSKITNAVKNGDAVLSYDGSLDNPVLKKTTGFWETAKNKWNEATKGNEDAHKFMNEMDANQRLEFLKQQPQENNLPYAGSQPSASGSFGGLLGENAPMLAKGAAGAGIATAALLAAPETLGASLAGLPAAAAFFATAPDMINSGGMQNIIQRYQAIKKENPEMSDILAMENADVAKWAGGASGLLSAAVLTGEGLLRTPISEAGKSTFGNALKGTLRAGANMGITTGAIKAATDIEGATEGMKITPEDILSNSFKTGIENATVGSLLHLTMAGLHGAMNIPPLVLNGAKRAIIDSAPLSEIQKTSQLNEDAGQVPIGTTKSIMTDLVGYKDALAKTEDGLSEDAKTAVAGLIQKKTNLIAEQASKDDTAKPVHQEKIDGINNQINEINRTGDVNKVEFDNITGEHLDGKENISTPLELNIKPNNESTSEINKPVLPDASEPKEQGTETTVPKDITATGSIEPEAAGTVLNNADGINSKSGIVQNKGKKSIPENEPTHLTKEESAASKDIDVAHVKSINVDNGLTIENIDANKHLFTSGPFDKIDFENVKNLLNETRSNTAESAADEPKGISHVSDKKAGLAGKETHPITGFEGEQSKGSRSAGNEQSIQNHTKGDEIKLNSTSIKNKVVDGERKARGEEPFVKPAARTYEGIVIPEAKKAVDNGEVSHTELAKSLAENPRPISDTEVGILTYGRKLLQNEEKSLMNKIESAQKSGDKDQETILRAHLEINNENLINNDIASEKSGTATARGLAARRMAMAEDYSLDRMLQRVRINNDGKVSDEARKQIVTLTKQLEEAQNKLETHQEETSKKQAEDKVDEIKKQITKETGKVPGLKNGKISDKTQETKKKVSDFFNGLKIKSDGALNSSIVPPQLWNAFVETIKQSVLAGLEINAAIQKGIEYLKGKNVDESDIENAKSEFNKAAGLEKETKKDKAYSSAKEKIAEHETDSDKLKAITPELLKLAKEHIRDGMDKMDDIVDAIHEKISPDFDELNKREVRDAISGYGKTLELNKNEVEKQLRELKAQARLVSGIEDIAEGKAPLRSGLQRDEQSHEVRTLRKKMESDMRKAGIELTPRDITKQFKTALDGIKGKLQNNIEDLTKAINEGNPLTKKIGVEYDAEANALKDARDKVKEIYDTIFKKDDIPLTKKELLENAKDNIKKRIELIRKQILSKERTVVDKVTLNKDQEYGRLKDVENTLNDLLDKYLPKDHPTDEQEQKKVEDRILNSIEDLNRQINNNERDNEIKKDPATNVYIEKLKTERDTRKEALDLISPREKKELTNEQRAENAKKLLEKSIKEYQRRIDELDFAPKNKNDPFTTPEIESLKAERDILRKSYNDLIPDEIVYKARIEKFSKNLDKRQVALQERIDTEDFDPRPKREALLLDSRLIAKKAAVEKTKRQLDRLIEDYRLKNRGKLEKTLDTINKIRRSILLSSVSTILKLGSAAMQRPMNNIAEGVVGSLLHYPLRSISSKAPSEGGILKIGNEANALYDFISKDTFKESWAIIKEGLPTDMDALHAKKLEAMKGFLELPGRTHKALKNPVKKYAYKRAFLNRAEFYAKQGQDIHDPKVIAKIDIESYNDAERAIFMQENIVTKAINNNLMYWEKSGDAGKVLAASVRFLLPIIKIPSNFVAETSSYYLGAAKAGIALRNGVQSLKPEQADYVYRALKKQGVGAAVFTLGYFSAASVGGFYIGKRDEADLKAGDVVAFGTHLPHWLSHTPLWTLLHAGATFRRLEDEAADQTQYDNDGSEIPKEWLGNALKITLKSTVDNLPFVQTPAKIYDAMKNTGSLGNMTGDLAKSFFLPPDVQKVANYYDKGEDGETREVEAKGFWKRMQMGVPFLRNNLETKN